MANISPSLEARKEVEETVRQKGFKLENCSIKTIPDGVMDGYYRIVAITENGVSIAKSFSFRPLITDAFLP